MTGASRGVGRGVAIGLGEAGATVYVTGRSADGRPAVDLGGTVGGHRASVDEAGGRGVPVRCDHCEDAEVAALFDRVREEQGRLDVLANSVWGGYEVLHAGGHTDWVRPFWEQSTDLWDPMFEPGVRAHYVAGVLAAQIMVPQRRGLIVNVSHVTGDGLTVGDNVAYSVAKSADNRMMQRHGDAAPTARRHRGRRFTPGSCAPRGSSAGASTSTCRTRSHRCSQAVPWPCSPPTQTCSTERVRCCEPPKLAREYGFTDVDGKVPEPLQPTFQ